VRGQSANYYHTRRRCSGICASVGKDSLDQALGGKIAHTFKPRTDQARAAISVVLKNPFSRYLELLLAGERDQSRRLACDRVLFPLFDRVLFGVQF